MSNLVHADPDGFTLTICSCDGGPYVGARKAGTPCCCEVCGYMIREAIDAVLRAAARLADPDRDGGVNAVAPLLAAARAAGVAQGRAEERAARGSLTINPAGNPRTARIADRDGEESDA